MNDIFTTIKDNARYIGDGVYVSLDPNLDQIWLQTQRDDGIHAIALDAPTFHRLSQFTQEIAAAAIQELVRRQAAKEAEQNND